MKFEQWIDLGNMLHEHSNQETPITHSTFEHPNNVLVKGTVFKSYY